MSRGQCTLPADEHGRILDRLAGLEQIISPEDIQQVLEATDRVDSRRCRLTYEVVLWVVLAMGVFMVGKQTSILGGAIGLAVAAVGVLVVRRRTVRPPAGSDLTTPSGANP